MLEQLGTIHPVLPLGVRLLAIVPEFGLRLYQKPAGLDLANLK